MSDFIDKAVESVGHIISEGQIQSAIGGLRQRLADADRRRKINLIKQEIRDLQAEEAQGINALSTQVWALYEAGSLTQKELVSLCKGVDEVREKIKEKEAELAQFEPPTPQASPENLCPNCSVPIIAGATFCPSCGTRLVAEEKPVPALFCMHCGSELREGARFCAKCGKTVTSDSSD